VAVQHAPEEIDPSPSQSSKKGEVPLSRLHFWSLNTIPFQPNVQPCQRYLTFLMSGNPIPFFLFFFFFFFGLNTFLVPVV
jgi:hypothetical protein